MAIKKIAILEGILPNVVSFEKIASNPEVISRFEQVLKMLKTAKKNAGRKVSPKIDDFLYASCIMMHAAESSLINQETGEPLLNAKGEAVSGGFKVITDHKGQPSVKWESVDNIQPYKNGNGDIFPEEDLLKAYKEWIGKPLCRDHVSSTVDGIRGIIIDTFYDPKRKRVHALFALDRKNYADLARKVEAGYATSVSMGTAVGRSICSDCGSVATTEAEYCSHVKTRECYGEVNKDLSPIELSIVVTGADPAAKIKTVLAHLKEYENQVKTIASKNNVDVSKITNIQNKIGDIRQAFGMKPDTKEQLSDINESADDLINILENMDKDDAYIDKALSKAKSFISEFEESQFDKLTKSNLNKLLGLFRFLEFTEEKDALTPLLFDDLMPDKGVEVGHGEGSLSSTNLNGHDSIGNSLRSDQDLLEQSTYTGGTGDYMSQAPQNFASFYADTLKTTNDAKYLYPIEQELEVLANQIDSLRKETKENPMTFADLKKRALERKSYFQGTEDPTVLPYDRMGDDEKIRSTEDKQMVGEELDTSSANPDEDEKKLLQRAELEQRKARRNMLLQQIKNAGDVVTVGNEKKYVDDQGNLQAASDGADDKDSDDKPKPGVKGVNPFSKKDDKDDDNKELEKAEKALDDCEEQVKELKEQVKELKEKAKVKKEATLKRKAGKAGDDLEKAEEKLAKLKDKIKDLKKKVKEEGKDKAKKEAALRRKAYFQGTEDPSVLPYPMMGNQDNLRESADKHMLQTGPMGGDNGAVPGDDQVRSGLQRIANKKLSATFVKSANPSNSKWEFFATDKNNAKTKVLSVTASAVYGNMLDSVVDSDTNKTLGDFFHSKQYGAKVINLIRSAGPVGAADEMGVAPEPVGSDKDPMDAMPDVDKVPEVPEVPEVPDMDNDHDSEAEEIKDDVTTALEKMDVILQELKSAVTTDQDIDPVEAPVNSESSVEPVTDIMPQEASDGTFASSVSDKDMFEAYAFLTDAATELAYIGYELGVNASQKLIAVANSALVDANLASEKVQKLVTAYQVNKKLNKTAMEIDFMLDEVDMLSDDCGDGMATNDYNREKEVMMADTSSTDDLDDDEMFMLDDEALVDDVMLSDDDELDVTATLKSRLAKRRAYRETLISQAAQYDDVYEGEHGGPGPSLGLEGDDKIENLHEIHNEMLDVATKDPGGPRVAEAAAKLDKAIKQGGINSNKLNELVALGAVDAEVAAYYKTFYGSVDGGSEFADGLVQEFNKAASQDDSDVKIIRYKRAYMLGTEAQDKGLVGRTATDLNDFVDNMVTLPDSAFNSFKNLVAQTKAPSKGEMPHVRGSAEETSGLAVTANHKDNTAPTMENLASIFLTKG